MTRSILFASLLVGSTVAVSAQAESNWTFHQFPKPNGAWLGEVLDIVETPDGAIWVATWGDGVHRIDGTSWTEYRVGTGLPTDWIRSLEVTREGHIWAISEEGIARIIDGQIAPDEERNTFTFGGARLRELRQARTLRDGGMALCTMSGEVLVATALDDGARFNITRIGAMENIGGEAESIAEAPDGTLWVSLKEGHLAQYNGQEWERHELAPSTERFVLNRPDRLDGTIWINGHFGQNLYRLSRNVWEPRSCPPDSYASVVQTEPGVLVTGGVGGIQVREGSKWRKVPFDDAIGEAQIRVLHAQRNGLLWIGTREGLVRGNSPLWRRHWLSPKGAPFHELVQVPGHEQEIWAVDTGGILSQLDGGRWVAGAELESYDPQQAQSRVRDDKDTWVEGEPGFLWVIAGESVNEYSVDDGSIRKQIPFSPTLNPGVVGGLYRTKLGQLWAYGKSGVHAWSGAYWEPVLVAADQPPTRVFAIAEDDAGNLYVGREMSFEIWRDGKRSTLQEVFPKRYSDLPQLAETDFHAIHVAKNGDVWIGTYGLGVLVYDGKALHQHHEETGLQNGLVSKIFEADDGTIWISYRHRGVASFRDGRWVHYGHQHGLSNDFVNHIAQAEDGSIWVSSPSSGIYNLSPDGDPPDSRIRSGSQKIMANGVGIFSFGGRDAWDRSEADDLLYSWRVVPESPDTAPFAWSSFSAETTAITPKLAPGRYRFEVRATDVVRNVDATPASMGFVVDAPFWQRPAFLAPMFLLALISLISIVLGIQRHLGLLKAQAATLEREQLYRDAIDAAGAAVYYLDYGQAKYTFWGDRLSKLVGDSLDDMTHDKLKRMIIEEEYHGQIAGLSESEALDKVLSPGGPPWEADLLFHNFNGDDVWISNSAVQVRDARGEVVGSLGIVQNITERKNAEKTLQESERMYREAIEVAGAVPYYMDYANERYEFIGEGILELTGYTSEEFRHETFRSMILESDFLGAIEGMDAAEATMRAIGPEGSTWRADYRIRTRCGGEKWLANAAIQVRNEANKVVGTLGILQDISDRKRAEETLRESERMYREAIEVAGAVPYYLDYATDTYEFMGEGIADITGYSPKEYTRELSQEIVVERVLLGNLSGLELDDAIALAREGDGISWRANYCVRRRDNQIAWMANAAIQVLNDTGEVVGSLGIYRDITQRMEAENALRESERLYRQAIEVAGAVPYYQTYTDDSFEFMGAGIEELTECPPEQLTRDKFHDMILEVVLHGDLEGMSLDSAVELARKEDDINWRADYRILTPSGKEKWIANSAVQVRERTGRIVGSLGIFNDITDEVYAEEERTHLEAQLRQSQKLEAIGKLAGGIAHDFNNLLTAINGFAGLLTDEADPGGPFHEYGSEILRAGNRAAALTNQLLSFSSRQVLRPRVSDLSILVREMDAMLRRLIGENIQLSAYHAGDLHNVLVDRGQIEQIVLNLVINARDAMPHGGTLTLETANVELVESDQYDLSDLQPGSYVMLTVSDTGEGMDESTRIKIFDPFFTTKEVGHGTGLGLATVFGIVKQSDGYIGVYSEPSNGTTFKIYFPRVDSPVDDVDSGLVRSASHSGTETILVVEDDERVRDLVARLLARLGYASIIANSPAKALELFRSYQGTIDLLLTDVVMPGMNGPQLAKTLKTELPYLHVLYVSGYTDDALMQHGVLDRRAQLLNKPFTPDELGQALRELLDNPGDRQK
jgi:PAS domain S-box-containing protein